MPDEVTNSLDEAKFRVSSPRTWNGNLDSLQALSDRLTHVSPGYSGTLYYVITATGSDLNDGKTKETAWATIAKANATIVAGDVVLVVAGAYDEQTNITANNVTFIFEPGVQLANALGTVLTLTGNNIRTLGYAKVLQAGQIGVYVIGGDCILNNLIATGCATGFRVDGPDLECVNCHSDRHTVQGWDIRGARGRYNGISAEGNSAAVRGIYLSVNTADFNKFVNCFAFRNTTAGFEAVAGADNNQFNFCSADLEPVDAGTNNVWTDYSIGSQIVAGQSRDQDLKDIYDTAGDASLGVNAILTLQGAGATLTATGGVDVVHIENAPAGIHAPRKLKISLDNMVLGDGITIRINERLAAGGGLVQTDTLTYTGADGGLTGGDKVITIDLDENRYGWSVTLEQNTGTYRDFVWWLAEEA